MRIAHLSLLALTMFGFGTLALRAEDTTAPSTDTAKHKGEFRKKILEKFDTNHDGKLDDTEKAAAKAAMQKHHQEMLAKYDTNGDGKLDPSERKAVREARHKNRPGSKTSA